MSIKDEDGTEIVTLSTIHAMAFRVLIWIGIIGTPVAVGMFWSMNERIANHSKDISFHEWRIQSLEARKSSGVSQSVNVGSADALVKGEQDKSGKTWLTTQQVAVKEKVTDRTVLNYIESGMIEPEPMKQGKSWVIAENYRILPHDAEKCGNETD
jgi:hypothetical protein